MSWSYPNNLRKPFYGIVPPGQTVIVTIAPPVAPTERVTFVSTTPSDTGMQVNGVDSMTVTNRGSSYPLAFLLMITPNSLTLPLPTPSGVWQFITNKIKGWGVGR